MATELPTIRPRPLFIFLVCLLLFFLKSPDAILNPQFWAEDGAIFYAQQFGNHWPQLTTPYAGYIHFVPRIIAWLAIPVKPLYVPLFYNTIAIIIDSICVAYSFKYLSFLYGATAALISFFLLPTVGDIYGTLTNVQWFMQFPLVLSVLQPGAGSQTPPSPLRMILISALIVIACLTGPFCVVDCALILSIFGARFIFDNYKSSGIANIATNTASVLNEIVKNIQSSRLTALGIGAALQLSVLLSQKIRTPDSEYALSMIERSKFGLLDSQSLYVQTIIQTFAWRHEAVLLIYLIIGAANTYMYVIDTKYKSGITLVLLSIGAMQPILAFKKQQALHVLTSTSHYYYFYGVICFCSFASIVNNISPRHQRSILIASCMILACLLAWKPQYLSRPSLIPMNWPRFAEEISVADHDVVVPLNPDWRAVIPSAQTHGE